ncbi:MAG: LysR family transcriptional regulator [Betaproteobacteria bacterium]
MSISNRSIDQLPLEWVRVFEASGRTGSFTAAAHEIGLTQAAVSQRIQNLEARIGARLFSRQARGVTLTVQGEAWLPYVSQALQGLQRSAEELFGKPLAKVEISASASVNQLWIVPRLVRLDPDARYQVSLATMTIQPDFARSDAMLEIRYGNGHWPGLVSARLYRETLSPLATPAVAATVQHWQQLAHIALSGPRPGWQEWAQRTGDAAPPIPQYRFDSFVAALAAARSGLGVVLGSLPLCEPLLAEGTLVRLSTETLTLDAGYWLTAREGLLPGRQWEQLVASLCQAEVA